MENFLVIENLIKKYGSFLALDEFSCDIPKEVTGLLGPNGAGKTTLLRAILGVHRFESGIIKLLDYKLPNDLLLMKDIVQFENETSKNAVIMGRATKKFLMWLEKKKINN